MDCAFGASLDVVTGGEVAMEMAIVLMYIGQRHTFSIMFNFDNPLAGAEAIATRLLSL